MSTVVSKVITHLCLMATFYTPAYYASQMFPILQIFRSEYVFGGQGIEMGHRNARDVDQETGATIPHLTPPEDVHIGPASLPLERVQSRQSPRLRTNAQGPITSDSATHQQVESRWTIFAGHRCVEWCFLLTGAGGLLLASPAILQIPGMNSDPVVRGFIYFLISRFGAVVPSAMVLMYYFYKSRFRSARFAMFWCQNARENRHSCIHMPYIILASPAVYFCWGLVFLVLTFFLSMWRGGLYANDLPAADKHPLLSTGVVGRMIITMAILGDMVYILWLVITLKAFDRGSQV